MNVHEAMKYAYDGQKIKRRSKNEWIVAADKNSQLRWEKNRQVVILTPADVIATDWMIENDEITVSKNQLEESLAIYGILLDQKVKKEFFQSLGFR